MLCPKCEAKNSSLAYFCINCGNQVKHFSLLKGLRSSEKIETKLLDLYKNRYRESSPLDEYMKDDTYNFLFTHEYRDAFQLPVSEKEAKQFLKTSKAKIEQQEDIYQEIVIIGYLYRVAYNLVFYSNSLRLFQGSWAKPILSPEEVIQTYLDNDRVQDQGFAGIPFGPHFALYDSINKTINKNLSIYSSLFDTEDTDMRKTRILILENIGYFLAERDLFSKSVFL